MIGQALQAAGYEGEPTEANLVECYIDYANAYGAEVSVIREMIEEGTITIDNMCKALIRCN